MCPSMISYVNPELRSLQSAQWGLGSTPRSATGYLGAMDAEITNEEAVQDTLVRAARGDENALEQLARRWHLQIRRWVIFEVGDADLAEEATRDVFIALIRTIDSYDRKQAFGPWLRKLVQETTKRKGRPQGGRGSSSAIRIFGSLSARQREVLHLCTQDGLSAAAAAEELGIAGGTVQALLARARRTVRTALLKEGG